MLNDHHQCHVAGNMYKFVNDLGPEKCCNMFSHVNERNSVSTKSAAQLLLNVAARRIKTTEHGIRYFGQVVWNQIPLTIRNSERFSIFKSQSRAEGFEDPA